MTNHLLRMISLGFAALAVTVVASSTAPAGAARAHETSSSFGMTSSGGEAALGTVTSPHPRCVKGRKVRLFQIRAGRSPKLVGADRTGTPAGNGDGYWVIPADLKPGRKYQAVVLAKRTKSVTCKVYKTSKLPFFG